MGRKKFDLLILISNVGLQEAEKNLFFYLPSVAVTHMDPPPPSSLSPLRLFPTIHTSMLSLPTGQEHPPYQPRRYLRPTPPPGGQVTPPDSSRTVGDFNDHFHPPGGTYSRLLQEARRWCESSRPRRFSGQVTITEVARHVRERAVVEGGL